MILGANISIAQGVSSVSLCLLFPRSRTAARSEFALICIIPFKLEKGRGCLHSPAPRVLLQLAQHFVRTSLNVLHGDIQRLSIFKEQVSFFS